MFPSPVNEACLFRTPLRKLILSYLSVCFGAINSSTIASICIPFFRFQHSWCSGIGPVVCVSVCTYGGTEGESVLKEAE